MYKVWQTTRGRHIVCVGIHHPLAAKLGLALRGGVQVLLEPDQAQHTDAETLTAEINAARDQIERRVSGGFGVSEPSVRVLTSNGQPRIVVELPGFTTGTQPEAITTLLKTATL